MSDDIHGFHDRVPPAPPPPDEPIQPPQNIEAEAALLGALMIDNRLVDDVVARLRPFHFYEPLHGRIYEAIVKMVGEGKVTNPVTLKPIFQNDEVMKQVGGPGYLGQLTGSGAAVIGARDFGNQIVDLAELRAITVKLRDALDAIHNATLECTPTEIVANLEAELATVVTESGRVASVSMGTAARDAVNTIEETAAGKEPNGFLIRGFEDYNHVRGRMEGGDFDLLGGRPSMGKTATSLAIGLGAATAGEGTEILSLEMKRELMVRRTLANLIYRPEGSCSYADLVKGRLSKDDWARLADAKAQLEAMPYSISDPHGLMIEDVMPFLRKRQRWFAARGQKMRLVIVDHVGRLQSRRKMQETELVSHISRTLKSAARELDCCILALAQLNRGLEQRENKRPMLADLRQSGSLEQDADNVCFVYREEYYLGPAEPPKDKVEKWQAWADAMDAVRDDLEIYSSKRREGALAKRTAKFFTKHQAIRDHGDYHAAPSFFDEDNHIL
ncbi:MAG: DnaB-like helicase C-terminal domain-containing protein [Pseudomonadota bacterium]